MMMDNFDTSWVKPLIDSIIAMLWNLTFGTDGIFKIFYNWIPVIGNNPLSIETWFIIVAFVPMIVFMKYYGNGIILQAIQYSLRRLE